MPASRSTSPLPKDADVGVDADLEEEHRDEEVTDRRELAPDALADRPVDKRDAGDEGTHDRRQLGHVGQLGERQRERDAMATNVPVDRETRSMAANSGGATRRPTTPPTTRNSTATAMIPSTDSTDTDPSVTRRTTTVSTTRPMTSSATAAPSTMRASVVASARRSPNTRR